MPSDVTRLGATGSVLRSRVFGQALGHGVGVPNPWHPKDFWPYLSGA
jgi:hypothetical protein